MAKEIVFYDKGNITQLFPVTEASSVYTTTTGQTVRQELDTIIAKDTEQDNRLDALEKNNDVDLSSYYTKTEVDNANASQNIYIQGLDTRITEIENTEVYTKTETDTLLQGKENTLVSGTTIKTINGQDILGSGDITIESGGGLGIAEMTKEEYDNLTVYDPSTLYVISDSPSISELLARIEALETRITELGG